MRRLRYVILAKPLCHITKSINGGGPVHQNRPLRRSMPGPPSTSCACRARRNRDRRYVTLAPARVGLHPRICSRGTHSPDTVFWRNRSVMAATRPHLPRSCPRAEWRGDAAKQRVPIRSGAPAGRGPAGHRDATPHQSRTGGPAERPQLGSPIFRSRRAKRGSLRRSLKTGSTPRSGTRSSRCFTACSSSSKACSLSPSPAYTVAIR